MAFDLRITCGKGSIRDEGSCEKAASDSQRFRVDTGAQIITVSSSSESDEDTSFSYIEESKALLVRKGSTPTDLDILRVLDSTAHIHAERGELVNAYKCYMEKLTYLRSKFPNKKRAMAEAAYNVGAICSKMCRHQEAIMYYSEALTLHQRTTRQKDEEKIALLLKCLGSSYLSIKNPILALVHFKEHQALCGMGGEKELLSVMGISRGKQFDLVRSLDCYAKVLDIEASEDQWLAQHKPLGPLIETLEQIFASPKNFQAGQSVNEKARDCQDLKTILINLGLAQLIRNPKTAQPTDYIRDLCHYLNEDGCIDGVDFTRVLFSMGNILLRRNRYREAIVYYEKCIFSYIEESKALLVRKGSTPTDLDILRVLDSTAHIHAERGELVNAYKCYMEKLTYLRSKFPNKKRAMAEAAYNVGAICSKMCRHQEAIMYYSEALTLHQRTTRQKDEEKIALLLKCLGSSYLSIKNPILALVHFKEHQALCGMGGEKELLSVMGISRGKQFDLVRSLDCYAKVLDIEASEDQWLAQHKPLGPLIETLEQIFASPKNFQAGQSVNEKARDCQDLKTILINLGLAQLIRNPKTAQPTDYIRDLCHYLNEDGCIDGVDFTRVLFSMGNILLRRNRYREAIVYYEKCIASYTEEDRDTSNDYVDLLTNLGTAHLRNGDLDKSFKHFRSALKEVKRARRRSSNDMSSSPENEVDGLHHFSLLLQQARDQARGRENDENVLNLRHIIALYLCMDHRASEAVELLLDIERRMIKLVGEEHPDILQLRVDLSVAQLIAGSPQIARATYERAIGPVSQGRIPEYHPFYTQYNRLIQVHYPTPVMPVVAHQPIQPVQKPLPVKTDFVPRMA